MKPTVLNLYALAEKYERKPMETDYERTLKAENETLRRVIKNSQDENMKLRALINMQAKRLLVRAEPQSSMPPPDSL